MDLQITSGVFILVSSLLIDTLNLNKRILIKVETWDYWILLAFASVGYMFFLNLCFSIDFFSICSLCLSLVISVIPTIVAYKLSLK